MDPRVSAGWKFDAFISYSTSTDYQQARKIESFLEGFHKAFASKGRAIRSMQICRDGSDFRLPSVRHGDPGSPGSDTVWSVIVSELEKSRYLMVLCSAGSVRSPWVAKEIAWMRENRGNEWILPVVMDGEDPVTSPEDCFPSEIRVANLHVDRIWYDLRGESGKEGRLRFGIIRTSW